jgi:hypothetical protein
MAKYEIKMKMLRTGEVTSMVDDGGYDPMKDMMAHSSSLKVSPRFSESRSSRSVMHTRS